MNDLVDLRAHVEGYYAHEEGCPAGDSCTCAVSAVEAVAREAIALALWEAAGRMGDLTKQGRRRTRAGRLLVRWAYETRGIDTRGYRR